MHHGKMTTIALAALLSGGALYAESGHAGKKESSAQKKEVKRSSASVRSDPGEARGIRAVKPSREPAPEVRSKTVRTVETARHTVTQKEDIRNRQERKEVNRQHYWVPPTAGPLPYHHRPGYITRTIPKVAMTLALGGLLFYYSDGVYYRHHSSGFIVVVPPIGLIVPVLPLGYTVFQISGSTYYYYAGVYYVWDTAHLAYRVTEVPEAYAIYRPGDIVETLPDGAYTVTIDGVQYYRYDGVYFMQSVQGERVVYIVVTP